MATALASTGDSAGALASHQKSIAIREQRALDNPTVIGLRDELAESYNSLGALLMATDHPAEALEAYRRAMLTFERLVLDRPSVIRHHSHLGAVLHNIAEIEIGKGRWDKAREGLTRAIKYQRAALAAAPGLPLYRQFLLAHLLSLAKVYQALKQPAEVVPLARECATLARGNPSELYDVACTFALAVPLTHGEEKQTLKAEAIQTLKEARAAGWSDGLHTSRDPSLTSIRDRNDFRRLLSEMFDSGFPANPFGPDRALRRSQLTPFVLLAPFRRENPGSRRQLSGCLVVRGLGQNRKTADWQIRLGLSDLPSDVFA